jgi:phosphate transport system protein
MSHYEERLEEDLGRIRSRIAGMADDVTQGLRNAVHALQTGNHKLAAQTILNDHPINRTMREIDRLCHAFIAVHLPTAGHLRLLSSAIRANIAIERIGDYAVTIARVSEQLSTPPHGSLGRELERVAGEAQLMLSQAVEAFNTLNADAARATMVLEQEMEYDLDTVYGELTSNSDREAVRDLMAVFIVLTHLKRVADQAKNLCEETVFAVTGQTKAPKVYNILFVDEDNSGLSQIAEAVARKTYPESGNYSSGGRQPAGAIDPVVARFLDEHGMDISEARPAPLELTHQELVSLHIIVSMQGPARDYFGKIPFHTTALEWDVGPWPVDSETSRSPEALEALYREIAVCVRDLMETLRGENAP